MLPPCRLLALDLDGTLLRDDGEIAPADRRALRQAERRGLHITIATGRLVTGALPTARALGLDLPIVCLDGGAIACPRRLAWFQAATLPPAAIARLLAVTPVLGLTPFFFTPDVLLAAPSAWALAQTLGWSPRVMGDRDLYDAVTTPPAMPAINMIAIGAESAVRTAEVHVIAAAPTEAQTSVFSLSGTELWALRCTAAGTSKASGLQRVASKLGMSAAEVAVVGDSWNDVSMFQWAGRSYAMGQAPDGVARRARHRLRATASAGGGVAEAIDHVLSASSALKVGIASLQVTREYP